MKKFILILLVLLILFVPVVSYAEEITLLPPNDGHNYYYCFYSDYIDRWKCITSDSKLYLRDVDNLFLTFKTSSFSRNYILDKSTGIWDLDFSGNNTYLHTAADLKASNIDVYYWDEVTVFFSAPKVSQLLLTMKNQSPAATLKIILAGLIPLLGLVILAISFRKAWGFLRNQLQH